MIRIAPIGLGSALALGIGACGGGSSGTSSPPAPSPPPPASPAFADVTATSGIAFRVGITRPPGAGELEIYVAESTFGGVAAGDCDGDGDTDLFITYGDSAGSGPGGPNRLYLNQRLPQGNSLVFVDTAQAAGVANTRSDGRGNDRHSGPTFADMDGDGDLDLFVGGLYGDPSRIYRNDGSCRFEDVTANSPGIEAMTQSYTRRVHTISAAFGDYDLDGDLDMFLSHWGTPDAIYGTPRVTPSDHLWRNDSDGSGIRYVNVSESSGVSDALWTTRIFLPAGRQAADFTFTPTFARVDDDLWPDLLIAGDFGTSQALLNNGDGSFRSLANLLLRAAQNGMGSAVGDIDDDGDLDWFVTSIFSAAGGMNAIGNRLFRNAPSTTLLFTDVTDARGVADGDWGWGACFLDVENDGDLDIFQTNGWKLPDSRAYNRDFSADRSRLFMAAGSGPFISSAARLGIDDNFDARSVVCTDFDLDGDADILLLTDKAPNSAHLWENRDTAAGQNYLRVRLLGAAPNTDAAGARIFVCVGSRQQMREVLIGGNFAAQNPTVQVFGLGAASRADELRVEWPARVYAPGTVPVQPVTLISTADARLRASVAGETLEIAHPDR